MKRAINGDGSVVKINKSSAINLMDFRPWDGDSSSPTLASGDDTIGTGGSDGGQGLSGDCGFGYPLCLMGFGEFFLRVSGMNGWKSSLSQS